MKWLRTTLKTRELNNNSDVFFVETEQEARDLFIVQKGLSDDFRRHIEVSEITAWNIEVKKKEDLQPTKTTIRLVRREATPNPQYLKTLELVFFDGDFFYLDEVFGEMRPAEKPGEVWEYV